MLIVLLAGWSGAGKDTVANQLVSQYGFQRFAFADPVKEDIARQKQIPLDWLHDPERKKSYRSELISYGEGKRLTDPEVWARRIAADISAAAAQGQQRFVISDWRHLSELWGLQHVLPDTARFVPVYIRRTSQFVSPVADATEYALMGFPFLYKIINRGSLDTLHEKVDDFIVEMMIPEIS